MKILFISPNRQTRGHRVTPVGILYLASGLRQIGHSVKLLDFMFSTDPKSDLVNAINEYSPEIICISIRNINKTALNANVISDIELAVAVAKETSNRKVILGGAGFSLAPEELMRILNPDFGIIGEADNSLPALVESLEYGKPYQRIPGLIYREEDGTFFSNPPDIVDNLDDIPFQAIELIDHQKYHKTAGNMGVFTRKSCPQRCIYCAESQLNGKDVRLRSATRIVDEIEYIIDRTGVTDFDFSDTLFNVPREHAVDVCREIAQRKVRIRFEVELNPIGQDAESVALLRAAGCRGVTLTADSGSDQMLKTLQKGYTASDILKVAGLYAQFKIPYVICFLVGGPGENLSSIEDSIALAGNCPKMTIALFAFGIRVFNNTQLHSMLIDQGLMNKNDSHLNPEIFLADSFDDQCANRLLSACNKRLRFFLSEEVFCINSKALQHVSNLSNVRPTWKYIVLLQFLIKIGRFGRSPLYWDNQSRTYKCN